MLCSQPNVSYVVPSLEKLEAGNVLSVVDRRVIGGIGNCLDDLLVKRPLRKCHLIGSIELGQKLDNSSYTGTLGMLQRQEADLYLRGEPNYLHEEWLAKSIPIAMEDAFVGHAIYDETFSIFNLLDNLKVPVNLTVLYMLSFIGILAFLFLLNEITRRIRLGGRRVERRRFGMWKKIASVSNSFRVNRFSAIAVFILFAYEFIWLTQLFLTNNIKTNKVVVDTSQLIKDERDLFSTKRSACMISGEQLSNMVTNSYTLPTNSGRKSLLSRVYFEKTKLSANMLEERKLFKDGRCLLQRDPMMFKLTESKNVFLFGEGKAAAMLLATRLVSLIPSKIWLKRRGWYSYPLVVYYRREKPEIGQQILQLSENGMISRTYECTQNLAESNCRVSKVTVFETLEQYNEEFSEFSDLVLENFESIFEYYFLLCSVAFVAFAVHHLIKFTRKRAISIRPRLEICVNCILFWPNALRQFLSQLFGLAL